MFRGAAEKKLHKRIKVHRVSSKPDLYEEEIPEEELEGAVPEKTFEKVSERVSGKIPERVPEKTFEKISEKNPLMTEQVEAKSVVAKPPVSTRVAPAAQSPERKTSR